MNGKKISSLPLDKNSFDTHNAKAIYLIKIDNIFEELLGTFYAKKVVCVRILFAEKDDN